MRAASLLAAVMILAGSASAADLAKVDRSIRKEPAYQSKSPLYCLLVFGPKADARAWVVLDGDDLVIDRNGNGDLTEPGERQKARFSIQRDDAELVRNFSMSRPRADAHESDDAPIFLIRPDAFYFNVLQLVPRKDNPNRAWARRWEETPFTVDISEKSFFQQGASVAFAPRPADAPVLHFGGPLQAQVEDPEKFRLRRGESSHLYVRFVTPSLPGRVTTYMEGVAEDIDPVAEVEFPPAREGGEPTRTRVVLKERC